MFPILNPALLVMTENVQNKPSIALNVPAQSSSTPAIVDTVPPTWPPGSNLTGVDIGSTSLVLVWTPSVDDVGVIAYKVYQDVINPRTIQGNLTFFFVNGLRPGTTYGFKVEAGDAAGLWSTDGPSLTVTTPLQNAPPVITVPGLQIVKAGTSLTFTVNATDPDNPAENVTLVASGMPAGASFPTARGNPVIATFSWAPSTTLASGNYTFSFVASDNGKPPASSSVTTTIQVTKANQRIVVTVPGPQTISAGTLLSFAIVAQDPNLPPSTVSISASGLPKGASFDAATDVFSWKPTLDQAPGVYTVIFTVSNGRGEIDNGKVTITVSGSSLGVAPQPVLQDQESFWLSSIALGIVIVFIPWALVRIRHRRESVKNP